VDWNNNLIRRINPDGILVTEIGFFAGDGPLEGDDFSEPGIDRKLIQLNHPTDITFGPDGNIYLANWHNHKVRRFDPRTGLVRTMGGRGPGFVGDGGTWDDVLFDFPKSLDFGPDGTLYVLDQRNQRVRKITPDGAVSTIVGTGEPGYSGDGGAPELAQLNFDRGGNPAPSGGLAVGPDGNLYIADGLNYRIRRVDFARNVIETIAGNGEKGSAGDGGPALQAQLSTVTDLEFGPDGRLYMADTMNHCIRALDLATGTVAMVWDGKDQGPGLKGGQRILNRPLGLAFDKEGHLYIVDTFNSRILRVTL
jgi:sugar lactone lactonase YvrE